MSDAELISACSQAELSYKRYVRDRAMPACSLPDPNLPATSQATLSRAGQLAKARLLIQIVRADAIREQDLDPAVAVALSLSRDIVAEARINARRAA